MRVDHPLRSPDHVFQPGTQIGGVPPRPAEARPSEARPAAPAQPSVGAPQVQPASGASKIQQFEQRLGAKRHEDKWNRSPNSTGTGAIHCKSFHCKLVGESLEARLERGILPVDVALDICGQALEALSEAHTRGLVHRDLKPGNLFLTPKDDGAVAVKVLDFGIAKSLTEVDASTSDVSLTAPRTLLGSPLYMSPEQLRDASGVDVRADVWAMGVVLFECLTGRAPFESASVPELYAKILNEPAPSVRSLVPGVPAAVDALVARCLEKDRSARFADATELARAIQALPRDRSAFVDTLPAGARTLSEMPRGRALAVRVGAVATLVVAAAAGITVYRGHEEPPRSTASPSTMNGRGSARASLTSAPADMATASPRTTLHIDTSMILDLPRPRVAFRSRSPPSTAGAPQ